MISSYLAIYTIERLIISVVGIPYAKPPIGELRFKKPEAYGRFPKGGLRAVRFSPPCTQSYSYNSTEDCLYLNIVTPDQPSQTSLRPVIIYIHGGSLLSCTAADYDLDVLASKANAVVVTLNYRLGAFGFLTTGDSSLPGNYGLWDQHLAIKWVHENIESFGGDKNRVTLAGQSAGGWSVGFQMMSPHNNRKLFQRVIMMSGSPFSFTFINREVSNIVESIADKVNCNPGKWNFLQCLQKANAEDIMTANLRSVRQEVPFFPIQDGDFLPHDMGYIVSDFFRNGIETVKDQLGNFAEYDLFVSFTSQEGLMFEKGILDPLSKDMTGFGLDYNEGLMDEVYNMAILEHLLPTYTGNPYGRRLVSNATRAFYTMKHRTNVGTTQKERWLSDFVDMAGMLSQLTNSNRSSIQRRAFQKNFYCVTRSFGCHIQ